MDKGRSEKILGSIEENAKALGFQEITNDGRESWGFAESIEWVRVTDQPYFLTESRRYAMKISKAGKNPEIGLRHLSNSSLTIFFNEVK